MARTGYGGKTIYGARVGILMLDTKWPRPPGDTGNAHTWPFPVLYKVVPGASARVVVHEKGRGLGPAFLKAAEELVKEGADGITTTGGFLAIFQKELAAHVNVPVHRCFRFRWCSACCRPASAWVCCRSTVIA